MRWYLTLLCLFFLVGCPQPEPVCTVDADCDDGNACTTDACSSDGCENTAVSVDDGNACTTDACDPTTGVSHTPVAIDDNDACTADACDPVTGNVLHEPVDADDSNACTTDACDPVTGDVSHTPVSVDDSNDCTLDACDPVTGDISHDAIDVNDGDACTTDSCDPQNGITHEPVSIDDGDACTLDTCDAATGTISHTAVSIDDNNGCTVDACDPSTGVSHTAITVDDGNGCTIDACDPSTGNVSHTAVAIDDNNGCTVDACDPSTGNVSHTAVAIDDANACTTDACDPVTGNVSHTAVAIDDNNACTADACDPSTGVSHIAVNVDDNNACTTDACDPSTGNVSHTAVNVDDNNACTADSCDPLTGVVHAAVNIDDGNACTTDSCDPLTGVVHTAVNIDDNNGCTTDACDPTTGNVSHTAVSTNDGNACTTDACDPTTGTISHATVNIDDNNGCTTDSCDPITGVSHIAVNINDNNECTTDSCDPTTGNISHVSVSVDDSNACTTDACDPGTGTISHTPVNIDDGFSCTTDSCDPVTGVVSNTPVQNACADADGATCSTPVCDPTSVGANPSTGCVEVPQNLLCDDTFSCTVGEACDPSAANSNAVTGCVEGTKSNSLCSDGVDCTDDICVGAGGDTNGCGVFPVDLFCAAGEFCSVVGCAAAGAADQDGNIIISEFSGVATSEEFIELTNITTSPIDIRGFFIENGAGQFVEIVAVNDPTGVNQVPVLLPAGGSLFGAIGAGSVPTGAGFILSTGGGSFSIADTGDVLALFSINGGSLEDYVDFRTFVTDATKNVQTDSFPGFAGVSTQLDPSKLNAADNDTALNWCLSFRTPDTAGEANGSCSAFVINEVLYDFDHPSAAVGAGDANRVFVELAGPGGGNLKGVKVLGIDGATGNATAGGPNVTIGVTAGVSSATRMPVDGFFVIADGTANNTGTLVPNVDMILGTGDPENGAKAVRLFNANNVVIDTIGYGNVAAANAEGTPVVDIDPDETAISIARDLNSTDTNNNVADFHFDPTPTPGLPNAPVSPKIISVSVNDGLANQNTTVRLFVRDVGDLANINGTAPADNDIDGVFAGRRTTDGTGVGDGCDLINITDEGRGIAEITCVASSNVGVALRGNLVVENPAIFTGSDTITNGWTYTGVLNETNVAAEADFCNLQFPSTITVASNQTSDFIFGRIFEAGVTEAGGFSPNIFAEVGFGTLNTNPTTNTTWVFFDAIPNVQVGNDDEYAGLLTAPTVAATTNFSYTFRFSVDNGLNYTYCDLNGAGSNAGLTFESTQLGVMTVTP